MFFNNPHGFPNEEQGTLGNIDWNSIINQGFGIGSQLIGAFGKRPTTQIAYGADRGIFAIQGPAGSDAGGYPVNPYAGMSPQQMAAYQASLGGGVGSGIDGVINWIGRNPMIVLGGAIGAYLLFKDPPGRR